MARIARMTRIVQYAAGFGLPNRRCDPSRQRAKAETREKKAKVIEDIAPLLRLQEAEPNNMLILFGFLAKVDTLQGFRISRSMTHYLTPASLELTEAQSKSGRRN